jgi:hypothetical protein
MYAGLPAPRVGYQQRMTPDQTPDPAAGRAEPLPEERAAEEGGEDRQAEAEQILRESEERIAEATDGSAPGDAAAEHRRSEDTVDH